MERRLFKSLKKKIKLASLLVGLALSSAVLADGNANPINNLGAQNIGEIEQKIIDFKFSDKEDKNESVENTTEQNREVNPYDSTLVFSKNIINSILISEGFFNLKDEDFKNINLEDSSEYDIFSIDNPLGISTGCNTITADTSETITIIIAAITEGLGSKLGMHFLKRYTGLPDLTNPKEIFEFAFDTTTTLMCQGKASLVQATEHILSGESTKEKHKNDTKNDEQKKEGSNTQTYHVCALQADKDDTDITKKNTDNKNKKKKSDAEIEGDNLQGQNEKFKICKNKYEELKNKIYGDVTSLEYLYNPPKIKRWKSSCDLINKTNNQDEKRKGHGKANLGLSNNEEQIVEITDGIVKARTAIGRQLGLDEKEYENIEIVVDKEAIQNSKKVLGGIEFYKEEPVKGISANVYLMGVRYANVISSCINGYSDNWSEREETCRKISAEESPFPMVLRDNENYESFSKSLATKKLFCNLTEFNTGDEQFLKDTIGYVSFLLEDENTGTKPIYKKGDMEAAIDVVIKKDYCNTKYDRDIQYLEKKYKEKIGDLLEDVRTVTKGLDVKMPLWEEKQVFFTNNAEYSGERVTKVCGRSLKQDYYMVSTIPEADLLSAIKYEDKISKIRKVSVSNIVELEEELGSKVEEPFNMAYDVAMLCNGVNATQGSTCKNSKITCGIDFEEKNDKSRKDSLYKVIPDKSKGAYKDYEDQFKQKFPKRSYSKKDFDKMVRSDLKNQLSLLKTMRKRSEVVSRTIIDELKIEFLKNLNNLKN